jgi:hypothetical protein
MKKFTHINWVVLTLVACLAASPLAAQKIQGDKVWTTYHKTPVATLAPRYATYSLDYDLGSMMGNVQTRPSIQGLTYQKADGDLQLIITVKNVYVSNRKLNESRSNNKYSCYYTVDYSGDWGYTLRDTKTDQVLTSYHRSTGQITTQAFTNPNDLNAYMNNGFVGERVQQLLQSLARRVDFALNPHNFEAGVTLNTVDGSVPAYVAINKATADLKALLVSDKTKTPTIAQVRPITDVWQQYLAKVNWDDKKSEINRKVASALLENMCVAAILTEDYLKLQEYLADYSKHNTGIFSNSVPFFETDTSYGGTSRQPQTSFSSVFARNTTPRFNVYYDDLVADVIPAK